MLLIVLTTTPNDVEAKTLAAKIIELRLAACVQILPQMTSVYVWDEKTKMEPEHLLLIKTLPEKYDELQDFLTANHSYSIPEIVAVRADKVFEPYHAWIKDFLA